MHAWPDRSQPGGSLICMHRIMLGILICVKPPQRYIILVWKAGSILWRLHYKIHIFLFLGHDSWYSCKFCFARTRSRLSYLLGEGGGVWVFCHCSGTSTTAAGQTRYMKEEWSLSQQALGSEQVVVYYRQALSSFSACSERALWNKASYALKTEIAQNSLIASPHPAFQHSQYYF